MVNKTFKCGVKAGFRNYLNTNFNNHVEKGFDPAAWIPKLTMGELKPFINDWVQIGVAALKTEPMKETIKKSFAEDGRFAKIRSQELQISALLTLIGLSDENLREIPDGEEVDNDEYDFFEDEVNYYMSDQEGEEDLDDESDDDSQ